jgi:hypothetical protein
MFQECPGNPRILGGHIDVAGARGLKRPAATGTAVRHRARADTTARIVHGHPPANFDWKQPKSAIVSEPLALQSA